MNSHCKICGRSTTEIVHKHFGIRYYRCPACAFICKDEKAVLSKQEQRKVYENHNNSIHDPKYVDYFKKFIHAAVLKNCKGKHGFDFGSGPSPVLAMILERDYGFHMDIYDLIYAPQKVYLGKQYDLITSTEVVEHLKNPLASFQLFKDCLKPDGLLSIMTLFSPAKQEAFLDWHYIRDKSHISFYTPKTMAMIGKKIGLKVVYTDYRRYISLKQCEPF